MSIFGIGIDIVEIKRIKSLIERHGELFVNKILHPKELEKYLILNHKEKYLAKRFAAKEAFAKALGTGIAKGVSMPKIEVTHCAAGKPSIVLHSTTLDLFNSMGVQSIYLSISDEKEYAVAQVVLEKNSE